MGVWEEGEEVWWELGRRFGRVRDWAVFMDFGGWGMGRVWG